MLAQTDIGVISRYMVVAHAVAEWGYVESAASSSVASTWNCIDG